MPAKRPSVRPTTSGRAQPQVRPPGPQRHVTRGRPRSNAPGPQRRALPGLLLVLALSGLCGAWWLSHRPHRTVVTEPIASPGAGQEMEASERALREAAQRQPRDAGVQAALGTYLLEHRRPYAAMEALQNALELAPDAPSVPSHLAMALVMAREPQAALSLLDERNRSPAPFGQPVRPGGNHEPGEVDRRRVAAAAYLAMGDAARAAAALRGLGAALEHSPTALFDLASAGEAMGHDVAAAAAYRRYTLRKPGEVAGWLGLARAALRQRHADEALAALARADRAAPGEPRVLYQRGLVLLTRGAAAGDEPLHQFQQLLAVHPGYGPAQVQLGRWYQRHGQPARAAAYLSAAIVAGAGGDAAQLQLAEALEAAGRRADACYQRGVYFMETRQPQQAIREFQRMVALDPRRPEAPLMASTACIQAQQKVRAAAAVQKGLERFPDDPQLLARRVMLYLTMENRAAAASLCRDWLSRQPSAAAPYRLLGRIAREELNPAEAIRWCRQALERDPNDPDSLVETARSLAAAPTPAHLHEAAGLLQRAAALKPTDPEPPFQLAQILQRLGDLDDARQQLQRSLDLDPTARERVYMLSQLCRRQGKSAQARFYAQIVAELQRREQAVDTLWNRILRSPGAAGAHADLARLYLQAGDLAEARRQLAQAAALQPGDSTARQQLPVVTAILELREH
jgi:tetratricopeptide (TPR) repeat protein